MEKDTKIVDNSPEGSECHNVQSKPASSDISNVKSDPVEDLFQKAKELVIAGMPINDAADSLGLSRQAVYKRAQRQHWPTKCRVKRAAVKLAESPKTVEMMAASLLERGEKFRARLLDRAEASIEAAELKPLEDWRDAKLALDIVDTITGLNKPQASTNILISGVGSVSMDGQSADTSPFYRPLPDSAPENPEQPGENDGPIVDAEEW